MFVGERYMQNRVFATPPEWEQHGARLFREVRIPKIKYSTSVAPIANIFTDSAFDCRGVAKNTIEKKQRTLRQASEKL